MAARTTNVRKNFFCTILVLDTHLPTPGQKMKVPLSQAESASYSREAMSELLR